MGGEALKESGLVLGSLGAQGSRQLGGAGPLAKKEAGREAGRGHYFVSDSSPCKGGRSSGQWKRQQRGLWWDKGRAVRPQPGGSPRLSISTVSQFQPPLPPWGLLSEEGRSGRAAPAPQEAGRPRFPWAPGAALEPATQVQSGSGAAPARNGRSRCCSSFSSFYFKPS